MCLYVYISVSDCVLCISVPVCPRVPVCVYVHAYVVSVCVPEFMCLYVYFPMCVCVCICVFLCVGKVKKC